MTLCGPGLAGARTSSTARPAAAATPPSCATTIAAYRHPPRIIVWPRQPPGSETAVGSISPARRGPHPRPLPYPPQGSQRHFVREQALTANIPLCFLQPVHARRPQGSMHQNCPVCQENLFNSTSECRVCAVRRAPPTTPPRQAIAHSHGVYGIRAGGGNGRRVGRPAPPRPGDADGVPP